MGRSYGKYDLSVKIYLIELDNETLQGVGLQDQLLNCILGGIFNGLDTYNLALLYGEVYIYFNNERCKCLWDL